MSKGSEYIPMMVYKHNNYRNGFKPQSRDLDLDMNFSTRVLFQKTSQKHSISCIPK